MNSGIALGDGNDGKAMGESSESTADNTATPGAGTNAFAKSDRSANACVDAFCWTTDCNTDVPVNDDSCWAADWDTNALAEDNSESSEKIAVKEVETKAKTEPDETAMVGSEDENEEGVETEEAVLETGLGKEEIVLVIALVSSFPAIPGLETE